MKYEEGLAKAKIWGDLAEAYSKTLTLPDLSELLISALDVVVAASLAPKVCLYLTDADFLFRVILADTFLSDDDVRSFRREFVKSRSRGDRSSDSVENWIGLFAMLCQTMAEFYKSKAEAKRPSKPSQFENASPMLIQLEAIQATVDKIEYSSDGFVKRYPNKEEWDAMTSKLNDLITAVSGLE